jgi:hypothetical protein
VRLAEERLQRLVAGDTPAAVAGPLDPIGGAAEPELDARTAALVRLGALIALGAADFAYEQAGRIAHAAGASEADIVGTLLALGPTVGLARLVAATPGVSLAVGYDIEAAFEGLENSTP